MIRIRIKEYNDLFTFNYGFLKRTAYIAPLSKEEILRCGITGPNARASGVPFDLRKDPGKIQGTLQGYEKLDFQIPVGRGEGGILGDAHDRFLIRLREMGQSIELLKQLTERIPGGEYIAKRIEPTFVVPAGEAYARIESSRGLLGCHVVSDGRSVPNRVAFRTPTVAALMAIPTVTQGIRIEDLPVVLASFDLSIAEADR